NLKEAGAENLKFTVLVNSTAAERWVSFYHSDAAKAGVKVNIRMVKETSQWWNIIQDGKFEALAFEGGLSESVHPPTWHSKGEYNGSGFNDKKVDFLIDQLQLTFDPKKRAQIQRQMIEQIRP